ncbi:MAG: 5-(carboxyamino)imidazole ribonucleotide mutase [Candidatus Cloacimonadaceae bacterium]|jgi:phosphoribosylaminoimidazole carboxylase PurE protein|nr:5-(carboxyamino)imidazole ribonucleotide mutase [Candidatus Cloacimonadota bacterium]MDX9949498.1 5-(carboxyamino)imidazole ribonucleotide mutase [Candidatus Syntrophosphaera sp.]NLN85964.1 5-(carboxyamino)imidazole ribonucleotide mutase [Candidatus Cloacimonadota bacterium]
MPKVRVILGSKSDLPICEPLRQVLEEFGVDYDFHVSSAHRKPQKTAELAQQAENDGVKVIIAAAGMAAHLPGVLASHTVLPVIGLPLDSGGLGGLDALLAIVQMPPGVPVASVAIGGAKNAALLAVQILALQDDELREKFRNYKQKLAEA